MEQICVRKEPDYEAEYHPCRHGIHLCGVTPDGERPLTLGNVPGVGSALFAELESHYALPEDDESFDLVVDFMDDGNILNDFAIRRQSLDALLRSCTERGLKIKL